MTAAAVLACLTMLVARKGGEGEGFVLNDQEYLETRGVNVLVFSNRYNDLFSDSKMSGIEIIHHGVRTATNGDVRLSPTPEQWDPVPQLVERRVDRGARAVEVFLRYPPFDFAYTVRAEACEGGVVFSVDLERPLPRTLEGKAGFNLEFLPSAYFGKAYRVGDRSGIFPLYPGGPMERDSSGVFEPEPIARGTSLVLAPEDSTRRVTIQSRLGDVMLFDGRNRAQNGWFVVRSVLPPGKSGRVVEWLLTASSIRGWIRPPVIACSQVGYHPAQKKVAVIELDRRDRPLPTARVVSIDGKREVFRSAVKVWGRYLRYTYATFDFTPVREPGLYVIEYGDRRTNVLRIAPEVYDDAWHHTLDVFFPVQMDHMSVREAYRVWHGVCHLDDALQAPVNHEHFDLYAQGPTTDSPYRPGEHIPGLNVGGWFDAGDFDLRTQSHCSAILNLVQAWEAFHPGRDQTTVDQRTRSVEIHHPDGKPDLLQQIEHGALQLVAQHRAVGHAIPGIIDASLSRYTHLGDASTQTDNLVGGGRPDDRWAFTSRSSALNYGSAAALAAASRALRGYNDSLAGECLAIARRVWEEEQTHPPDLFRRGNTTGGPLEDEILRAAVELLICSGEVQFADRIRGMLPHIERNFDRVAATVVRAIPCMDGGYREKIEPLVRAFASEEGALYRQNPFGVPISTGGWGGNGLIAGLAGTSYVLHRVFPDIVGAEFPLTALGYLFGCHPASAVSFVSGVGVESKRVAYGSNRADFSFIAGGVVPGIVIVKPDFPESKDDWPFLWGENEYVINLAAAYLYLVQAACDLTDELSHQQTRSGPHGTGWPGSHRRGG